MNHPVELILHQFMESALKGEASISKENVEQIASDIADAVNRQFNETKNRSNFRLRMSNIGRPACQLWFEKNKPETATPMPYNFLMNMLLGDIIEAVFKGLLREANVEYTESDKVTLVLDEDTKIDGSYDLILNGAVDDVKSASGWSYDNKFESFDTLKESDGFGYIAQLAGYAKAANVKAGGWWVVNKTNGEFKYVKADSIDVDEEINTIYKQVQKVLNNTFERQYEPIDEKFRGKETGNKVLNDKCKFCSYRFECWPTLQYKEAVMSKAKEPKMVPYVEIAEEYL